MDGLQPLFNFLNHIVGLGDDFYRLREVQSEEVDKGLGVHHHGVVHGVEKDVFVGLPKSVKNMDKECKTLFLSVS